MTPSSQCPWCTGSVTAMICSDKVIDNALQRNRLLGTREFFLRESEMLGLLRYLVNQPPGPTVSLNRPHAAGQNFVHRAAWLGMTFVCVSFRPFVLS